VELALAGPTLFDRGVRLDGAVVEATYAHREPPLIKRLRETDVPFMVDLQALRFASPAYLEVASVAQLPYAPSRPVAPGELRDADVTRLAEGGLEFQQWTGARRYLAPGVPLLDNDVSGWMDLNFQLLAASARANGGRAIDRRPLVAHIAPGRRVLSDPAHVLQRLMDFPVDGVYVQPLNLHPTRDSVEKLAQYVDFLWALKEADLTVIVGRVGAFGLLLQSVGVADGFDSGLGEAESYSWSDSVRPHRQPEGATSRGERGRDRRVYLEPLKTTLASAHIRAIIDSAGLRSRFTCTLGCCEMRGFEELLDRGRQHYLWTRQSEIGELRQRHTSEARLSHAYEELVTAREHARVLRRAFDARAIPPPNLSHLDRWIALLTQYSERRAVA